MVPTSAPSAPPTPGPLARLGFGPAALLVALALSVAPAAAQPSETPAAPDTRGMADDDLELLLRRFDRARGDDRETIYAELDATLPFPELLVHMQARVADRSKRIGRSGDLRRLGKIAELRKEADVLRKELLETISDEVVYFTPYRQPEASPEREAEYRKVQERIDERTEALRELWASDKSAKVKGHFAEDVEDLVWTVEKLRAEGMQPELHGDCPAWVLALHLEREEVDVRTFVWSPAEARELRRNEAVLAYNRATTAAEQSAPSEPREPRMTGIAAKQVEVTNAYRVMLGRGALTFDVRLYRAASKHADYCAQRGALSHVQHESPTHRTVRMRTKIEGYEASIGENLSLNSPSAEGTLEAWRRSPGHHRVMVMPNAREMASALSGNIWCQVFGANEIPLDTLEAVEAASANSGRRSKR